MRYGLELVKGGAFGPNVEIGVQLQDEPVIVAPAECPEVAGCTPALWTFQVMAFYVVSVVEPSFLFLGASKEPLKNMYSGVAPPETGDILTYDLTTALGGYRVEASPALVIFPSWRYRCGHRTRFSFVDTSGSEKTFNTGVGYASPSVSSTGIADVIPSNTDTGHWTTSSPINEDGAIITFSPDLHTGTSTIEVKMQIDLTDAAFGAETWTDIGPVLHLETT